MAVVSWTIIFQDNQEAKSREVIKGSQCLLRMHNKYLRYVFPKKVWSWYPKMFFDLPLFHLHGYWRPSMCNKIGIMVYVRKFVSRMYRTGDGYESWARTTPDQGILPQNSSILPMSDWLVVQTSWMGRFFMWKKKIPKFYTHCYVVVPMQAFCFLYTEPKRCYTSVLSVLYPFKTIIILCRSYLDWTASVILRISIHNSKCRKRSTSIMWIHSNSKVNMAHGERVQYYLHFLI